MSSYRFCRTDDINLLVDALNRCWHPHFPDEAPMTPEALKRSIRDLQVWCSSCMVAFSAGNPIGVLIGAKRASGTLIHKIAIHPDHQRQGHGRHLLTSLSSKLAILGPPRIVAEVPETFAAARGLFEASGFAGEAVLTDFVWEPGVDKGGACPDPSTSSGSSRAMSRRWMIPVTVDDLNANGLLEAGPAKCWDRAPESLQARKDEIAGIAVASDEQIEACVLYDRTAAGPDRGSDIVVLRSFIEDGGDRLGHLLSWLRRHGLGTLRFSKVDADEISGTNVERLGFRPVGRHLYAMRECGGP